MLLILSYFGTTVFEGDDLDKIDSFNNKWKQEGAVK
jgi:hypothetical protein